MRYRIEYADGRYCNFANGRAELLKWLKLLKKEEISDIWLRICQIPITQMKKPDVISLICTFRN